MTETSPFDAGLEKSPANFQPLTPLGFLERAAAVYPERTAVVYGTQHTSYGDFYRRCRRLAAALAGRGIGSGAVVAVMAPNVPALLEAHFGVPMAGAVLNPLNVRLDAPAIAEILDHGGAQTVICDRAYGAVMTEALGRLGRAIPVIAIDDGDGPGGELPGATAYEALLGEGDPDFEWRRPGDEWQAISLNYTSGTTGAPKGVVYHHRGAYLNALGNALAWSLPAHPVCLWTLPMFHCNGWCFPWTVTALAGTHVCLRQVEPGAIFAAIEAHAVTHFCGAPVVLNLLANAPEESRRPLGCTVEVMTAASAPPASVIPRHFQSFADGLRSSLRRRPAAVIVGEARDRETIEAVVRAADYGIAVYSTAHTIGVAATIRRLLAEFPAGERAERGAALIDAMNLAVTQVLAPNPSGTGQDGSLRSGRTALREWLIFDDHLKAELLELPQTGWPARIETALAANGNNLAAAAGRAFTEGRIGPDVHRRYRASAAGAAGGGGNADRSGGCELEARSGGPGTC